MGLILERPTFVILKKQRFYCKACGQTFTATTPYINPRCTISNDVKLMVSQKLSSVVSEKDIAHSISISPSTVHRYLKELGEYIKTHKANYSKAININKVYIIREDDVDLSYYVMLLPEEY